MSGMQSAPAPAAPTPSAAPSPDPAPAPQGEVAINPNQTSGPTPVGSQAPPKSKSAEASPVSRREATRNAIQKAFTRTTEPGPAKPRMGHNRPPEAMEREAPAPLDLKKRPSEQPQQRGEHGHFAPAANPSTRGAESGRQAGQVTSDRSAPVKAVQLPAGAAYAQPPSRFDARAKAEWGGAPESVRASVHRMHQEFSNAYQRMAPDHQEMNQIRHFANMAKQHGTTLERALHNYVSMEEKLRADPVGGLDVIVNNLNLRTRDGQRLGLKDIAWHVLNLTPDQHRTTQMNNTQTALMSQIQQLQQQNAAIATQLQRMQYRRQFNRTRRGVDAFAQTHPRLDELGVVIERELRAGYDLPTAYRRAELLHPATQAVQTRTASAQTRTSDRSIRGAPDSNSSLNGKSRKPVGRREAIANAIRRTQTSF